MQSSKLPRKTSKSTEKPPASGAASRTSEPRTSRTSKKAQLSADVTAAPIQPAEDSVMKHHHSLVAADTQITSAADALTASAVTHEMIAQLAHSYWAERGYAHGSADRDWLQAEQHLLVKVLTASA